MSTRTYGRKREALSQSFDDDLRRLLTNLSRRLRDDHPDAAASLDEGLDETITVKRLGLPSKLERELSTTNAIENLMERSASSLVA